MRKITTKTTYYHISYTLQDTIFNIDCILGNQLPM